VRSTASDQLARVRARIDDACRRAARDPGEVALLAVTKDASLEQALALFRAGQRDFGESRPQSLQRRRADFAAALGADAAAARWHLIGHLQRNKLGLALDGLHTLHSLDRASLVEPLCAAAAERVGTPLDVFVQVKLRNEANKGGFAPGDVPALAERLAHAPGLRLVGLMALAPWLDDGTEREREAAAVFTELAALAKNVDATHFAAGRVRLSMGMSGDLEPAIAAGSHWLRIGSALFENDADPGGAGARP